MSEPPRMKDQGTDLERELWRSALEDGPRPQAWEKLEATMAEEAPHAVVARAHGRARRAARRRPRGKGLGRYGSATLAGVVLLVGGVAAARALGLWPSRGATHEPSRVADHDEVLGLGERRKATVPTGTSSSTATEIAERDAQVATEVPGLPNGIGVQTSPASSPYSAPAVKGLIELVRPDNRVGGGSSMGVRGNWYSDGDGVTCPSVDPCGENGCCMKGRTRHDPTFQAWGCVLGLELNAPAEVWAHEKLPYAGSAKGFDVEIEGTTGGAPLRILFTQESYPIRKVSPMVEIAGPGRFHVRFDDAMYPAWCAQNEQCGAPPGQKAKASSTYDLEVQVVGGLTGADFDVCVKSLSPFE